MILKIYGYIIPTHFALYYDKIFVVIMQEKRTLMNILFHLKNTMLEPPNIMRRILVLQ